MDASVPEEARGSGEVQILRRIGQHDGPAVELQLHRVGISVQITGLSTPFDTRQ
jgi:hypothetical protein